MKDSELLSILVDYKFRLVSQAGGGNGEEGVYYNSWTLMKD